MKRILVFLVVLSCAACLPAAIISQGSLEALEEPDYYNGPPIKASEDSNMVCTSADPNYILAKADDPNYRNGFICDNNTSAHAYWKVGNSAVMTGPNDPNITPSLQGDGSLILVFVLPARPTDTNVVEADLACYVGWISALESVDLYGIRWVAAGTPANSIVKKSDYYVGLFGCDPDATPIQTEYIQMPYTASINLWHITGYPDDTNGPDRLRCWLQAQYDDGAKGGDYVLLRLNVGGYRPIEKPLTLPSYCQVQVSSMWDNTRYNANDHNDPNTSIPFSALPYPENFLTKTSAFSPRLFIRFNTDPVVCPGPRAYCCRDLPGDLTGNCDVNAKDLVIVTNSWLDKDPEVSTEGLLSCHAFEGGAEERWNNSVAGGFKAIPFDACEPNIGGKVISDEERGRVADIHGSESWLYVGPDPNLDSNHITTQITVAAWVKSTTAGTHRVMGKGYSWYLNVPHGWQWVVRDANDPDTSHPTIILDGNHAINDGVWHHVAATYDAVSGDLKLYTNGAKDANLVHTHGPTGYIYQFGDVGSPYAIGARIKWDPNDANIPSGLTDLAGQLHGYVDDVRIYNRVLSAEEVQTLANAGLIADITKDREVDFYDFAMIAKDWLECAWFLDPKCLY